MLEHILIKMRHISECDFIQFWLFLKNFFVSLKGAFHLANISETVTRDVPRQNNQPKHSPLH